VDADQADLAHRGQPHATVEVAVPHRHTRRTREDERIIFFAHEAVEVRGHFAVE
jgi:hypothetical protein